MVHQFIISLKTKRFQTISSFPTQTSHHLSFLNQFLTVTADKFLSWPLYPSQMWSPPHTSSASHLGPWTFPCAPSCSFCRLWGFWHGAISFSSFPSTRYLWCKRQPCNKGDALVGERCTGQVLLWWILHKWPEISATAPYSGALPEVAPVKAQQTCLFHRMYSCKVFAYWQERDCFKSFVF